MMKYKKKYLKTGGENCPFCQSEHMEGGPVDIDGAHAHQEVSCPNCNAVWKDTYTLTDTVTIDEPEESTLI
jgi:transposase-like protein